MSQVLSKSHMLSQAGFVQTSQHRLDTKVIKCQICLPLANEPSSHSIVQEMTILQSLSRNGGFTLLPKKGYDLRSSLVEVSMNRHIIFNIL